MRFFLMIFLVCVGVSGVSQAASFDCAKAQSFFEKAICTDGQLSVLDEQVAKAYSHALHGLSDTAYDVVRQSQRDWLKFARRRCSPDGRLAKTGYDVDGKQCLATVFTERLALLEQNRGWRGHRAYALATYSSEPNDPTVDFSRIASLEISSVRLDGQDDLARAFNAHMDGVHAPPIVAEHYEGEANMQSSAFIDTVTPSRITILRMDWLYFHGAAHGQFVQFYDHFLIKEKRPLVATDIFAAPDWLARIDALIVPRLKSNASYGDGIWENLTSVSEMIENPDRWNFAEDGISFQFQSYEVGSYALGAPAVTLFWQEIENLLARDAYIITNTY